MSCTQELKNSLPLTTDTSGVTVRRTVVTFSRLWVVDNVHASCR